MPAATAEPGALAAPPPSLRTRLLWRVLLPLAATWSVGNAVAFTLSWTLAGRAFDRALLDDAYAIAVNVVERDGALVLNLTPREVDSVLFDHEEKEYFSVQAADGRIVASSGEAFAPPRRALVDTSEFGDGSVHGEAVRIARLRGELPRPFVVAVAQTTHTRQSLLLGLLARSVLPQAILVVLLGAYLRRQISRELQPLVALQRELDRRDSSELEPIAFAAPSADVEKLRASVNSLLGRVRRGVQAQREFAGNVAHDLRTPLAGIRALAEYGLARDDAAVWRQQLQRIAQSEERASHLVDQLLALALADEAQDSVELEDLRIDDAVRRILLGYVARADAAGVDLGAAGLDEPIAARAAPVLLDGVLSNLIDNALRYGRGSEAPTVTVTVRREAGDVVIGVADNGPGLEPAQRDSLARRWAKGAAGIRLGAGAGLGLAIASRYATLMGGSLVLVAGPKGRGLCAVLRLVAADAATPAASLHAGAAHEPERAR